MEYSGTRIGSYQTVTLLINFGNLNHPTSVYVNTCKLECEPMSNAMAARPNIGGALCSTLKSLADAHYFSAVQ